MFNQRKLRIICIQLQDVFCISKMENAKRSDEILLKICDRRGTKRCKSDRSRQELSNEYLVAKIGVDTAENEPLKVHLILNFFSYGI